MGFDKEHIKIKKILVDLGMNPIIIDAIPPEDLVYYEQSTVLHSSLIENEFLQIYSLVAERKDSKLVHISTDFIWKKTPFFRKKDILATGAERNQAQLDSARGFILYQWADGSVTHGQRLCSQKFQSISRGNFTGVGLILPLPKGSFLFSSYDPLPIIHVQYSGENSSVKQSFLNLFASYYHVCIGEAEQITLESDLKIDTSEIYQKDLHLSHTINFAR